MSRIVPVTRRMRVGAVPLLALCLLLPFQCRPHSTARTDGTPSTARTDGTPRQVEPRVTRSTTWRPCTTRLEPGRVVPEAQCQPALPESRPHPAADCWNRARDQLSSVGILIERRECTDAAVARLERLAAQSPDASTWSDLAAAYYVRAQRYDRASDLLRAFDAAQEAITRDPSLDPARFNYALAAEALGLNRDAVESWRIAGSDQEREWAAESRQRLDALRRREATVIATAWPLNAARLAAAARLGDAKAVRELVAPYPAAAQQYVESTVLVQWAAAAQSGVGAEAHEHLALAKAVATTVAGLTGDRYLLDGVEFIERASRPDAVAALRRGHIAFEQARRAREELQPERARNEYDLAIQALQSAGSPFALGATVERIGVSAVDERSFTDLDRVAATARDRRYGHLWAAARSTRATLLSREGRYLDALNGLDEAARALMPIQDSDALTRLHTRKASVLLGLGNPDLAWRDVLLAMRYAAKASDDRARELVLSEAARAALALGHPIVALRFQNEFVIGLQDRLARNAPDGNAVRSLRPQLAAALSARAEMRLRLFDDRAAMADLSDAMRLAGEDKSYTEAYRAIRARIREVEGQTVLRIDARRAVQAYTEALTLTPDAYPTFRADLLLQRASAYGLVNDRSSELADLQSAVEALREEERGVLSGRRRGDDPRWAAHFTRSNEAFSLLIRHMAARGNAKEAFHYEERKRLLASPSLDARAEDIDVGRLQTKVPKGTAIVEYETLDDRTLIWVITADRFELLVRPDGRLTLATIARDLHQAAQQRDPKSVESALFRLYSMLLEAPLKTLQGAAINRLVIVPGNAMQSIPFAGLRNPVTKRYLVEDYTISVSSSATRYLISLRDDRNRAGAAQASILLVEAPGQTTGGLEPLRGAMEEITQIRRLYPDAAVLMGQSATVMNFMRLANRSTIIHLAVHAHVDARAPGGPTLLLFAPSGNDAGVLRADGLLKSAELQQARLVVLASCSTLAKPVLDPAPTDVSRAVHAAGVPAVLGSVWEVDDKSTTNLLVSFHRHYVEGHDAAAALRNAQLHFISHPEAGYSSVFAWAPFELIGYASSPFTRASR